MAKPIQEWVKVRIMNSMELTNRQAKFLMHELTRHFPPGKAEKLARTFAIAQVELKLHQVDAALLAFNSPLSKGTIFRLKN